MKKTYLFLLGCLLGSMAYSQSTSPEVHASSGDHFTGTNVELSWTIGETMTETFISGSNQLTQGFHQTNLVITSLEDLVQSIDIRVFPNPTPGLVNIEYSDFTDPLNLTLFDVLGRQLLQKKVTLNDSPATIDLTRFIAGSYFLHVSNQHSQTIKTFKIQKNN